MNYRLMTLLMAGSFACHATAAEKPRFRDALTHDQIVKRLQFAEKNDPMKKLDESSGEDPSKVNKPIDLFEQSDVISFRGMATLVPKRAILAAPSGVRGRTTLEPGSKFVPWREFYRLNRGWITTLEVSREQAEGRTAIGEKTQERVDKSRNLVVATYQGGPISVLEVWVKEEEEEGAKS